MQIVKYNREIKITNTQILPRGLGCKYLLVVNGLKGEFIAKKWLRKLPQKISSIETIIKF